MLVLTADKDGCEISTYTQLRGAVEELRAQLRKPNQPIVEGKRASHGPAAKKTILG
jgi:hypothetical protein